MEEARKEKLLKAGVDIGSAVERFMGNEDMLVRFLKKFSQDSSYQSLMDAMDAKQYEEAFKAAHTLKGVCGNLSLIQLFDVVSREVEFLRHNQYPEAEEMLPEVKKEYEKVIEILDTL